ncbi:aminopeptidase N [Sansalvadorimonas sp. 2012CJ34-2]|uniref:Aminopeptidase N n=1 Tax=Parendozoicomonas callyspongiae TaxID=2942213 RepID=A0ABT0PL31_9GAMM|nr:aminopeptidase N [Sansalvadorimonas sp. 2012CJ34-2]MCL6272094.1 aminopeptidase N [Sansalvadorimonas sp. 2012CJ34-2]
MKDAQPRAIYLKDYQQPDYWIETTHLVFDLGDESTRVTSTLKFHLNTSKKHDQLPPLELVGTDMELISVAIDGQVQTKEQYQISKERLILQPVFEQFETVIVNDIKPQENTSLEGLYSSSSMFCTQCEAEGFRKITYYLDRPDVMSVFTTTVIADKERFPVLLSNGNAIERKDLDNGRHLVTWNDPFKKPAYLFALVAGKLEFVEDTFTTMSGREVTLRIFVEPHNITKCDHAMVSLKKSMRWDEEVYGREYDLDIFMIVAVDDFNMGAMENKGLNIFNSSCVLARPDTATDATFQRIEAIVAHEYFHNWSGNRVTCRDWFQLSLKEGFTVFRDAEFSADMNSRTVKRVEDVNLLRSHQFVEDAGPMAHPIRPDSFIEINNFYTLTVYEKGAEVVRMIHNIVGKEGFRKGTDLYFERHDGQAVTCDDFVKAMEDANGVDLTLFRNWYSQAGTPVLDVTDEYDEDAQEYRLTVKQSCPATPGQETKKLFHIPLEMGLLDGEGEPMPLDKSGLTTKVLDIKQPEETFVFTGVDERPLPSLLRGFSAPVHLNYDYSREDLVFLMSYDEDGFNRWDSCQRLAIDIIMELVGKVQKGEELVLDSSLIEAFGKVLADDSLDKAMVAELLHLPSETYLAEQMEVIDIDAIHQARQFVKQSLAAALKDQLVAVYNELNIDKPYKPEADDIAERTLKNTCLGYLVELDEETGVQLAQAQYAGAGNMTDSMAAMSCLASAEHASSRPLAEKALQEFADKWAEDTNVIDMWFSTQAACHHNGLEKVKELMQHKAFDKKNPNKMRSLVGAFCGRNLVNFHDKSGSGYEFLADEVIRIDALNPQLAARLINPLTRWKRYDEERRELMQKVLKRIQQHELSSDIFEVVSKSLA